MEDNLSPKQQRGEDQQQTLKVCVFGGCVRGCVGCVRQIFEKCILVRS